jgi:predicted ester cyclase
MCVLNVAPHVSLSPEGLMKGYAFALIVSIALSPIVASPRSQLVPVVSAQAPSVEVRNEQVVRRLFETINQHDARAGAALHSEDTRNFGNAVSRKGIEDRQADVFTTFPDWHMEIVELVASGALVVVRARVTGTHNGVAKMALNGMPPGTAPTGKRFEVTHVSVR